MHGVSLMTSGKKHHKRRNVGLMYEFIVGHIVDAVGNDDSAAADRAVAIVRRRFKCGTELHREWRLFNAVVGTTGVDETMANAIIREARDACRRYDRTRLDIEKTRLIHEVNRTLGQGIYERPVTQYKLLATTQTLFNDWRNPLPNIGRIAEYERQLQRHLMSMQSVKVASSADPITEAFAVKLMIEKVNSQYGTHLTSLQRSLLGTYVADGMTDKLVESLRRIRDDVLQSVDAYISELSTLSEASHADESTVRQLNETHELRLIISELDLQHPDDVSLARIMKLCELKEALKA